MEPLSKTAIQAYFERDENAHAIWQIIREAQDLLEAISHPLYPPMIVTAYANTPQDVTELAALVGSALRDAIFDRYISMRYANLAETQRENLPFSLLDVYKILGHIAKFSVVRQRTGNAMFVRPINNEPTWGDWLVISKRNFGYFGEDVSSAAAFLSLAQQLGIVTLDDSDSCHFNAVELRDYFVYRHCVRDANKLDDHTIPALLQIQDERVCQFMQQILANPQFSAYHEQAAYGVSICC